MPVIRAALACCIGIAVGIAIYPPHLSDAAVLAIAGGLLVVGALIALLPVSEVGKRAILPVSGFSGLATVLAATPGPLMALEEGWIEPGKRVLFIHTGGQPALFAYRAEIETASNC